MATYGWGTNEPIIAPEAEGGENIGTVCVKIKSAITDTFTKLNSETWADASTTASGYMSASDKIKLNGIETGAEVNQFAFSNISVGGTTISADTKQDTLTLTAGTGITLTPDAGNDRVTISFASGANVNISGSSASCTGNAATASYAASSGSSASCTGNAATASYAASSGNAASATSLVSGSQNNGIISAGTLGHYSGAAFQAREREYVGANQTDIAYAPRISWHWGEVTAGNLILDRYANFHFTFGASDTAYSNVYAQEFFSKARNCWFAPQPTTSAGAGQFVSWGTTSSYTLPSGGTWLIILCMGYSQNSEYAYWAGAGIVAGGHTLTSGNTDFICGSAIRIA